MDTSVIRKMCKEHGISIADFEEQAGLSNGAVGKWDGMKYMPRYDQLKKVADYFRITVDEIVVESTSVANDVERKTPPGEWSHQSQTERPRKAPKDLGKGGLDRMKKTAMTEPMDTMEHVKDMLLKQLTFLQTESKESAHNGRDYRVTELTGSMISVARVIKEIEEAKNATSE